MAEFDKRITALEEIYPTIEDIYSTVKSIGRWVKVAVPLIASAAAGAGLVDGKWGAFIKALFT